jgi:hypothetical protein
MIDDEMKAALRELQEAYARALRRCNAELVAAILEQWKPGAPMFLTVGERGEGGNRGKWTLTLAFGDSATRLDEWGLQEMVNLHGLAKATGLTPQGMADDETRKRLGGG